MDISRLDMNEFIIERISSRDSKKRYEINFLRLKINFHFETIPCFDCTFNLDIHKNEDLNDEILFYVFCLFSYKIITHLSIEFICIQLGICQFSSYFKNFQTWFIREALNEKILFFDLFYFWFIFLNHSLSLIVLRNI